MPLSREKICGKRLRGAEKSLGFMATGEYVVRRCVPKRADSCMIVDYSSKRFNNGHQRPLTVAAIRLSYTASKTGASNAPLVLAAPSASVWNRLDVPANPNVL